MVKSWGTFKSDPMPVSDYTKAPWDALQLLDEVKFDFNRMGPTAPSTSVDS